jgi:hypothetical protein
VVHWIVAVLKENYPERAKRLLEDDFFLDVVKQQQEAYISLILNSSDTDIDIRERVLQKYRALEEFVASIQSIADQRLMERKRLKIF